MGKILSPSKNTPTHDLVYTPIKLSKDIIDHFNPTGTILDPCCGDGSFYKHYPKHCKKDWCELQREKDFFKYTNKVDWIITNPPWSKMRMFLQHGMEISTNIVYLVTINHFMTKARIRDMKKENFSFKEIYMVEHPKTENWPKSGFQLAAVYIQKNWDGNCIFSKSLNN